MFLGRSHFRYFRKLSISIYVAQNVAYCLGRFDSRLINLLQNKCVALCICESTKDQYKWVTKLLKCFVPVFASLNCVINYHGLQYVTELSYSCTVYNILLYYRYPLWKHCSSNFQNVNVHQTCTNHLEIEIRGLLFYPIGEISAYYAMGSTSIKLNEDGHNEVTSLFLNNRPF